MKHDTMLVGFAGPAGAGKSTLALSLYNQLKSVKDIKPMLTSFAYPVKQAAEVIFRISGAHFYDQELKNKTISMWDMTPREMLQKLGTEACRKGISEDIWIKSLIYRIARSKTYHNVIIIDDVRFMNEAQWINTYDKGMLVYVHNLRAEAKIGKHPSEAETQLIRSSGLPDIEINNSNYNIAPDKITKELVEKVQDAVHGI